MQDASGPRARYAWMKCLKYLPDSTCTLQIRLPFLRWRDLWHKIEPYDGNYLPKKYWVGWMRPVLCWGWQETCATKHDIAFELHYEPTSGARLCR